MSTGRQLDANRFDLMVRLRTIADDIRQINDEQRSRDLIADRLDAAREELDDLIREALAQEATS